MADYWILDGKKPVKAKDVIEWGKWLEKSDEVRRVAHTQAKEGVRISTVFLGLDRNFMSDGPPLLFETMIFGGKHDKYQERYSTWEQAEAGHKEAVALAKESE